MRKYTMLVIFLSFALLLSCNKEIVIIHDFEIPKISCPPRIDVIWDELDIGKTKKENELVDLNNIAKVKRLMMNREAIIWCYEQYLKTLEEKVKQIKKENAEAQNETK